MISKVNSFTQDVKEEIVSNKYLKERLISILSAFAKVNGVLSIKNKNEYIVLKIENNKIAKFIYSSIQKVFKINPIISYLKKGNLNKNTSYEISIINKGLLNKFHINILDNKIDKYFSENEDRIGGYLAGTFLSSGSVNSPRSSNYHLEVSFTNLIYAKNFINFLAKYKQASFNFKTIKRREKYVCYLKRSDQIVDFLVLIGATNACLYFESIRVARDVNNNQNRQTILDTYNYQKIIKSSNKDVSIINKLIKKKGLVNLGSEKVAILASLRVKHPEASLSELARLLSSELNVEVSKSNVNHILRALRNEGRNL